MTFAYELTLLHLCLSCYVISAYEYIYVSVSMCFFALFLACFCFVYFEHLKVVWFLFCLIFFYYYSLDVCYIFNERLDTGGREEGRNSGRTCNQNIFLWKNYIFTVFSFILKKKGKKSKIIWILLTLLYCKW